MSLWNSSSSPADPKSEIVKPPSLFEGFHSVPPWKSPTWFHEVMLIALALVAASWLDSFFDIVGLPLRCFRLFLGISFWVLWQRGLDRWPVVLLSSMLSVCMARLPADLMPAIAVAVVEVVCLLFGVWFVRRLVFGRNPGARLADALKFVLAGSLLASALSAFLSTALMVWLDPVSRDTWSEQFVIRWLAEALSILLSAPIGFAWWNWSWRNRNERGRWWELLLFVAMLGVLAVWTFARNFDANSLPIPDLVLVVPVSFWALVRWGSRGNSVATFAISIMSVLAALH
jgi:integral membrane sensor domain MASE1